MSASAVFRDKMLLERYQEWIERMDREGIELATYECPSCSAELKTRQPDVPDGVFDSLTECGYCNTLHFRVVYADGTIETELMGEIRHG